MNECPECKTSLRVRNGVGFYFMPYFAVLAVIVGKPAFAVGLLVGAWVTSMSGSLIRRSSRSRPGAA